MLGEPTFATIADQLGAVGIDVNFTDESNDYFGAILAPKYPAYFMILEQAPNDWQFVNFLLSENAVWNPSHYTDATSAELIATIQTTEGEEQEAAVAELGKYVDRAGVVRPVVPRGGELRHRLQRRRRDPDGQRRPVPVQLQPAGLTTDDWRPGAYGPAAGASLGGPMLRYILRRLAAGVVLLLVISFIAYTLLVIGSGDVARKLMGVNATQEQVAELNEELGLNRPILTQYFDWLGDAVTGDFGKSWFGAQDVTDAIRSRLSVTLTLVLGAVLIAAIVGALLGVTAALAAGPSIAPPRASGCSGSPSPASSSPSC